MGLLMSIFGMQLLMVAPERPCPSLKGLGGVRQLSKQEISDIVAYLRSFEENRKKKEEERRGKK